MNDKYAGAKLAPLPRFIQLRSCSGNLPLFNILWSKLGGPKIENKICDLIESGCNIKQISASSYEGLKLITISFFFFYYPKVVISWIGKYLEDWDLRGSMLLAVVKI